MINFDGKTFARELEEGLPKNSNARIVVILIGNDKASNIYVNLKRQAAKRVGVDFELKEFSKDCVEEAKMALIKANEDESVTGVMVQLPAPQELLKLIKPEKDVDGMKDGSKFLPATVRAVLTILEKAQTLTNINAKSVDVVGAKGNIGKRLVRELKKRNYEVVEFDKGDNLILTSDVVVSTTGIPGIIKNVKLNAILIDVGAPEAEITSGAAVNASFVTPVPGGVGPVTVACLMANLIEAKI